MKKIIIILLLLFLTSCSSYKTYNTSNFQSYIDELYLFETGKKQGVVYIDLRKTGDEDNPLVDEYVNGHIKGFVNYYFENGNKQEFTNWIKGLYHVKTTIFLIDSGNNNIIIAINWLKEAGYKKVHAFSDGYLKLIELGNEQLFIVTGLNDCAC